METKLEPTGLMLVGATFICMSILIGAAHGAGPADLPDLQSKLKEATSLKHVLSQQMSASHLVPKTPPFKQSISLSSSNPSSQVSDLVAINSVSERDIVCDEEQNGDPNALGLVNSLAVRVEGQKAEMEESWPEDGLDVIPGEDVEAIVDDALNSGLPRSEDPYSGLAQMTRSAKPEKLGNNLDIDVKGISVTALNTAEGGSAEATSNIIIKPVQIIICPSEVEEKLK
jgi:hypothetical protein